MSAMSVALAALLCQLQATERQTPDALAALQLHRLDLLTAHLETHSGHFRARLRAAGLTRAEMLLPGGLQRLPVFRHWPLVGFCCFREIAPVMQYQFIQDGRDTMELRLVTERPLSTTEEAGLEARVQKNLGFACAVHFTYFADRIPAGANGKFEEFVCRVAG